MSDNGVSGTPLQANAAYYTAMVIMTAIAWYNVLELNFLIFNSFKRYNGLYFWSLFVCSWGTALHALGFILKFFVGSNIYLTVSIITVGWYAMVTGQSVVLYSRIHIVVMKQKIFKFVLIMIIVDAILFHIPTTVLTFGANSPDSVLFRPAFNIFEKIQMTVFSLQEMIISAIYVQATLQLYRPLYKQGLPKPMIELILVNCIIIAMDISLLGVEYANLYPIEATMKGMIYSIKLKLEFAVLSELKGYTTTVQRQARRQSGLCCSSCGVSQDHDMGGIAHTTGGFAPGRDRNTRPSIVRSPSSMALQTLQPAGYDPRIVKTVCADVSSFPGKEMDTLSSSTTSPNRQIPGTAVTIEAPKRSFNDGPARSTISSTSSDVELTPASRRI